MEKTNHPAVQQIRHLLMVLMGFFFGGAYGWGIGILMVHWHACTGVRCREWPDEHDDEAAHRSDHSYGSDDGTIHPARTVGMGFLLEKGVSHESTAPRRESTKPCCRESI